MSATPEARKPLADYAPQTYRRLNPRPLKKLADELVRLVGPEERPADAKFLVAEYIAEEVKVAKTTIAGIQPEEFAAGILTKAGIAAKEHGNVFRYVDEALPVVSFEGQEYVVDFSAKRPITPLQAWPGL